MKKVIFVLGALLLLSFISCATPPPQNYFVPFGVTNNPVGTKVGESVDSAGGILQAAQNGGITYISTVDVRYTQIGSVVIRTFIVSGE